MNVKTTTADFIIIGAGIIGLNIASELKKRYPNSSVTILEKEVRVGEHASGRNSGVIHAGFYYSSDSLKAKFTKSGNAALKQYCLQNNIPVNACGKLVVARNDDDLTGLQELLQRGLQNQIEVKLISAEEAKKLEPAAKTYKQALFSPTTASVNPQLVLNKMLEDAKNAGIQIHFNCKYLSYNQTHLKTNQGDYAAKFIINAAGLYADKIAKDFQLANDYCILPFKGLYLRASQPEKINMHIYPVPVLQNPFLGVHFTMGYDGHLKIGPTAIPAFWREQYKGLKGFALHEMLEIITRQMGLLFKASFNFKKLAWQESKKYYRPTLLNHAAELVNHCNKANFRQWGKPGIRAQLMNIKSRKLEMDFILEHNQRSLHVLNAVSPAFTCAIPFASHVVDVAQTIIEDK